jgi:hypothetical protein
MSALVEGYYRRTARGGLRGAKLALLLFVRLARRLSQAAVPGL